MIGYRVIQYAGSVKKLPCGPDSNFQDFGVTKSVARKCCSAARGIEVPEATSRTVFSLSVPVKNLWSLDGPNALFGASALPFLMLQSDTFPRSHLSTPAWCARGPPGLWFHEHLWRYNLWWMVILTVLEGIHFKSNPQSWYWQACGFLRWQVNRGTTFLLRLSTPPKRNKNILPTNHVGPTPVLQNPWTEQSQRFPRGTQHCYWRTQILAYQHPSPTIQPPRP